ncbi:hypothetical protein BCR44DRAFT_1442926 [Catenaria anguillulae PL171]|uniref:Uncharacterized protein n=1 Tax=Catenaria anguillulae PL171 TaxID=765915 RepID=A0A1Y2HB20_9FUNG|nr:hypothetical protein BCR44DRAFT_1442926 [Catenaria anguillulae PL171]
MWPCAVSLAVRMWRNPRKARKGRADQRMSIARVRQLARRVRCWMTTRRQAGIAVAAAAAADTIEVAVAAVAERPREAS